MNNTVASTERDWLQKWITVRGPWTGWLTITYDVQREQFYRTNLIANRGLPRVDTSNSINW
jgi:hypothetical protein